MPIEFKPQVSDLDGQVPSAVDVYLDGRLAGQIRPVLNGWRYFPKGQKRGGEVFTTLIDCERSLLG